MHRPSHTYAGTIAICSHGDGKVILYCDGNYKPGGDLPKLLIRTTGRGRSKARVLLSDLRLLARHEPKEPLSEAIKAKQAGKPAPIPVRRGQTTQRTGSAEQSSWQT
jgi:hypothetical protein